VLAVLTSDQIRHAMFPLGDTPKALVRAEAAKRGLAVADKPDSHDVCFIADGDTKAFLAKHLGQAPGQIVDTSGAVLGEHDGTYAFTVGQRKGLRSAPRDDGKPRYVLDIEPVTRTVTVGPAEGLDITEIAADRPVWTGCARRWSRATPWSSSALTAKCTRARSGLPTRICRSACVTRRAAWPRPGRRPLRRRRRPRQCDRQPHISHDSARSCLDGHPVAGRPHSRPNR